ncbi:MlaD family protein [Dietzia maris]
MSGCDWKGPNSLPLPGTAGGGPDGYSVTVQLADVTTLDRNARVRVGDVTVGRIADIRLGPGFAEVTVDPDGEVRLPRNATARVGQSSLLGASHLELSAPPGEPAVGTLSDGDLVPVERSGGYPTTEQTLAPGPGGGGLRGTRRRDDRPHRRGPGGGGTPQRAAHRARGAEGGHRGGVGVTGEALDRTRDPQRRGGERGRRPGARTPGPRAAAAAACRGHPRGGHRHRDRGPCRRGLRR